MVIISNGFSKFHLSVAAAEADRRNILTSFVTGAYPTPLVRKLLDLPVLRNCPKAGRLSARREYIADIRVHALFSAETLFTVGALCRSESMNLDSLRLYGRSATRYVELAAASGARVYHYRAGFGGDSVEVARKHGMFTLCDHSIVHPSAVDALVASGGSMPAERVGLDVSPFWSYVLHDIERADAVLVNSRFVEDTFRRFGSYDLQTHVIYWGLDDAFLTQVPKREAAANEIRILFAGLFEKRKGAEILMDAVERLDHFPWKIEIAGMVSPDVATRARSFFSKPGVEYLGLLSRKELASAMARSDVFVFPSLAEGSARVVFEALACGCYVITTPNSGSVVENGIHGAIVPAGDSARLAEAIEFAYHHRGKVSEIGKNNAECVRANYRQCDYGDQLSNLYRALAGEG